MTGLKELVIKLRKTADMLEELIGINIDRPTKNETSSTAKKIVKKLKRKNPWKNPKYRTKMLKHMARMRATKGRNKS